MIAGMSAGARMTNDLDAKLEDIEYLLALGAKPHRVAE